jgi:hypothetical protein
MLLYFLLLKIPTNHIILVSQNFINLFQYQFNYFISIYIFDLLAIFLYKNICYLNSPFYDSILYKYLLIKLVGINIERNPI